MNIHPLFVHFPIAMLSAYAVFELLRFKKILAWQSWRYIKATLLFIGTLGTFAALATGDSAERYHRDARALVNIHSNFGGATTAIFCILSVYYISLLLESVLGGKITFASLRNKIFSPPVIIILALAGLVCVMITGALGGAIAYGPATDPVVQFIYKLFFP